MVLSMNHDLFIKKNVDINKINLKVGLVRTWSFSFPSYSPMFLASIAQYIVCITSYPKICKHPY